MAEGRRRPTIFELITALGFCWFKRQNCDVVVLEVGMGGRLDATNAILDGDSVLSVMVNIGFDHMEFLGDTLPLIAGEKAGIIKEGGDVVVYGQSPEVEQVFLDKAREKHATISRSSNEYAIVRHMDEHGTVFDFEGRRDLKISLLGRYQVRNACTAVSACDRLIASGLAFCGLAFCGLGSFLLLLQLVDLLVNGIFALSQSALKLNESSVTRLTAKP